MLAEEKQRAEDEGKGSKKTQRVEVEEMEGMVWWQNKDRRLQLGAECYDLLISVNDHLTFSPYSPSLHSLILQARYFVIHIDLWAQPLSALAIGLFIGPSLYHNYLL